MDQTWKCTANSVWIWTEPNKQGEYAGLASNGMELHITDQSGYWLKCDQGWVCQYDTDGTPLFQLSKDNERGAPKDTVVPSVPDYEPDTPKTSAYLPPLDEYRVYLSDEDLSASLDGALKIQNLRAIHGMPYQLLPSADMRIGSPIDGLGVKYTEKIVTQMPLLLMTPGTPVFLSEYSNEDKRSFLRSVIGGNQSALEQVTGWEGKYYSLKFDYVQYFQYVNPMCRSAARFLGIHNETIDGVPLDKYGWDQNHDANINGPSLSFSALKNLQKVLPYRGCVPFYIESETQISDSFSNSTTESPLSSKINSLSDMGRELNFILGRTDSLVGTNFDKFTNQEDLKNNIENMNDLINQMIPKSGARNIFNSLASSIQTVAAGGRLIFPEIWQDSSFSKSYSVSLKLTTPDCDKLSWYLNICVPLLHLMAFVLPRQVDVNGYISPFCVKAFYKGFFHVDMGIITDMTFNKGQEGCWTADGLPTVVDVSFTIKDLYSILSMTSNEKIKYKLMNNIMELDYIANMCGININEPDVGRMIDMWFTQNIENRISDSVRLNFFGGLEQTYTNALMKLLNKGFG